jgi:tetratricopeptide (TPR) repeat protein
MQQALPESVTDQASAGGQTVTAQNVVDEYAGYTKSEQYMMRGDKYFKAGDYLNAARYYYGLTGLNQADIKAWKKLAFCYYQLKKHNYAYNAFQMVLKYDKNDTDAREFMDYYKTVIQKSKQAAPKREMSDSLWRSAILPGFGQFYNNQGTKGMVIGGAYLCAVALTIYNTSDERTKYAKYLKVNENQQTAYKEAQDAFNGALMWGLIAGAVYAGAAIDACMNYDCEDARAVTMEMKNGAVYLAAAMRW